MRVRHLLPLLAASLVWAAPASAAVPHTVQPGETLWSIAAANNLTTRTVAAYNGLSEDAQVVLGSTIMVPTTVEGYSALQRAGLVSATPATSPSAVPAAPAAPASSSAAPAPQGAYTVRWGDTLSGLAAQAGVPASDIAAANGLSLTGTLLAGTVIKLPSGAPAPVRSAEPAPAPVVPAAAPAATSSRLSAADVQQVAAANGVSPSLAAAVAWQESGFNNGMVSSANARGVMQVTPGTWDFVQHNLAGGRALDPNSAVDNTTAGVLYLKHLIQQSGGDETTAVAGYYQGMGSVLSRGLFDDTRQYVADVEALRSRFGG
jgi:LysM repeat protein